MFTGTYGTGKTVAQILFCILMNRVSHFFLCGATKTEKEQLRKIVSPFTINKLFYINFKEEVPEKYYYKMIRAQCESEISEDLKK